MLTTTSTRRTLEPFVAVAGCSHVEVLREFIRQVGIKGCGGGSGGLDALYFATGKQHLGAMKALTDVGVIDTGVALNGSAEHGRQTSVKFLLQHHAGRATSMDVYLHKRDSYGKTPLVNCIDACPPRAQRIVRLLQTSERIRLF